MGAKTTRVTTQIAAQVTGAEDIAALGQQIGKLPDDTTPKVVASVSGDQAVAGLATQLARMPDTTRTEVAADVTGDAQVDALVRKLQSVPESQTFTVDARIRESGQKGGLKQVGQDIDEVKGKAKGLGTEGGAFAAQFLGPYSQSIGLFGDLGEQLANISDEAGENGAGGKLKALGKVGAGIGVAVVAGLAVDSITGAFAEISAAEQEVQGVTKDLTQTLFDNGDAWDDNAKRAQIAQLTQTTAFKNMSAAGIDYATIMDGLTGQAGGMEKLTAAVVKSGSFAATTSLKEATALSKTGANAQKAAQEALNYAKNRGLLTDAQKAGQGIAKDDAAAIGKTGDAADDASGQLDGATASVGRLDAARLDPKTLKVTADDDAARSTLTALERTRVPEKTQRILGDDTDAHRKITALKGDSIPEKHVALLVDTGGPHGIEAANKKLQQVAEGPWHAEVSVTLRPRRPDGTYYPPNTPIPTEGFGDAATAALAAPLGADAPAAVPRAFAAPTGRAWSTAVTVSPVVINRITVQGAVDKDGTARTIERLLRDRHRRTSSTTLGVAR